MYTTTETIDNLTYINATITGITVTIGIVEQVSHGIYKAYNANNKPIHNNDGNTFSHITDAHRVVVETFQREYELFV